MGMHWLPCHTGKSSEALPENSNLISQARASQARRTSSPWSSQPAPSSSLPHQAVDPANFFSVRFLHFFFFWHSQIPTPAPPPPSPRFGSLGRLPDAGVTGPIASARSGPVANFPAPFVGKPAVDSFLQEFDIPGLRFVLQETTDGQHSWPAPATGSSFFSPTRDSPGGWPARCPPPPTRIERCSCPASSPASPT